MEDSEESESKPEPETPMKTPHSQAVPRLIPTLAVLLWSFSVSALSREMEAGGAEPPKTEAEVESDKADSAGEPTETLRVSLTLKVPNGLWTLEFEEARLAGKEVRVYWRLKEREGMGTMAITTVSASKVLKAEDLTGDVMIRHFVSGKTWNWENETEENVQFIDAPVAEKEEKGLRLQKVE